MLALKITMEIHLSFINVTRFVALHTPTVFILIRKSQRLYQDIDVNSLHMYIWALVYV